MVLLHAATAHHSKLSAPWPVVHPCAVSLMSNHVLPAAHEPCALQEQEEEVDDGQKRRKVRRTQAIANEVAKRQHAQTQAVLGDTQRAVPEAELAAARRALVAHMQARETVMQALTRLSAKRKGGQARCAPCMYLHWPRLVGRACMHAWPRRHVCRLFEVMRCYAGACSLAWVWPCADKCVSATTRLQGAQQRQRQQASSPEERARQASIEAFTDAATTLLSEEADAFDLHKEELEHALRMADMSSLRPSAGASMRWLRVARCLICVLSTKKHALLKLAVALLCTICTVAY